MDYTPLRPSGRAEDRAVRLVCFPHAGGSASYFTNWEPLLAPGTKLTCIEYPGRGRRFREACCTNISALTDAVIDQVDSQESLVLFGHSLGALVAFEIAHRLQQHTHARLLKIVVSACEPPREPRLRRLHELPDQELLEALGDLGGTRPQALGMSELMSIMLPVVRADLAVSAGYACAHSSPLRTPIIVFSGADDHHVSNQALRRWSNETTAGFQMHCFEGGHFYLDAQRTAVLSRLNAECESGARASNPAMQAG